MGEKKKVSSVTIQMSHSEHYMVGRMLMVREQLTGKRWKDCEHIAEVICNHILRQLPVDHPESAIWDNRRPRR